MVNFQEIVDSINRLSPEEQDGLFELLRNRRIEQRRTEILANAQQVIKSVETGTAQKGSFEDLKLYLLADDEE